MATVVFDFDSTILSCESLEKILETQSPENKTLIESITEEGLRGKISFSESLSKRLAIAAPTREETRRFGLEAKKWLTSGIERLIQELIKSKHEVRIVSGGILESILPVANQLGIHPSHVHAVTLNWKKDGSYDGIDTENPFSTSKVEGCLPLVEKWSKPIIMIGDSVSDFKLYDKGLADLFILYTEHFRCEELLDKGVPEAKNIDELRINLIPMVTAHGKN